MESKFDSLRGSAVIPLEEIARVPALAYRNMERVKGYMNNTAELKYQRALVDPSHMRCSGVRVPRMMAEETATYRDYNSVDVNSQQFLVIANLELVTSDDFVCITD